MTTEEPSGFIPAREKPWFIALFGWYVIWLFKRRFEEVHIEQDYFPSKDSSTLYYLNHTSWWDGLIPLLLKQQYLHQPSRAMMEDKQMRQYRFFSWIGAFSVNLYDPKSALRSLRYALESLKRPGTCLFIYPEGAISPSSTTLPPFKSGIGWIVQNALRAGIAMDVVPVSIFIHTMKSSKPECHIRVEKPLDLKQIGKKTGGSEEKLTTDEITQVLHKRLEKTVSKLKEDVSKVS